MSSTQITGFATSPVKTILMSGLVAGILDLTGALLVYSVIQNKVSAITLMQSIASGAFGKEAFAGGNAMALYGMLFHFVIALSFATAYFLLYPKLPFFGRYKVIAGMLYGAFIWLFMNFVVLPLSLRGTAAPMTITSVVIGAALIVFLVGVPISLITHRHYVRKNNVSL